MMTPSEIKCTSAAWEPKESVKARSKRDFGTSAPTHAEILIYKNLFNLIIAGKKPKKNLKVLVLGATPEIRDLAIELGAECTAVDISRNVLESLTKAMKYKDDKKNKFVCDDWFNMCSIFPKNSFDMILGDCSFNNVPFLRCGEMFQICKNLLKKDGCIITRQIFYFDHKMPRLTSQLVDELNELNARKMTPMGFIFETAMFSEIAYKSYNYATKELRWAGVHDDMMQMSKGMVSPNKEHILNFLEQTKTITTIVPTEKEFLDSATKCFTLHRKESTTEVSHSGFMPVYLFRK